MSCKKLSAFIAGGVIGAGIALLFAPRTGLETRACVRAHVHNMQDAATQMSNNAHIQGQKFVSQVNAAGQEAAINAGAKSREIISQAQEKGNEFVSTIADNIAGKKNYFAESSDDLRSKIEEARKRIAAQVAHNAQESVVSSAEFVSQDAPEECIEAQACATQQVDATSAGTTVEENESDGSSEEVSLPTHEELPLQTDKTKE